MMSRWRRIASATALEQNTLLPFLYRTQTIARHSSEAASAVAPEGRPDRQRTATSARQSAPRHSGHHAAHHKSHGDGTNFREFGDYVPFDGDFKPPDPHIDLEGSTITPQEKRTFEELFKLKRAKDEQEKGVGRAGRTHGRSTVDPLDDIIESAGRDEDFPRPLRHMAREARERRERDKPSQADAILQAADKDKRAFARRLDLAQTDAEVWNVLQNNVFNRVAALGLDAPPATPKSQKKKTGTDAGSTAAPHSPPTSTRGAPVPNDLDILTHTLPTHLTHTLQTLTLHFPSSSLPLALLPHLKTLGPSAFALGTSTTLYNLHMRLLYQRHLDLGSIVALLQEMDEQVYPFDEFTETLIDRIRAHVGKARRGAFGEGVRAFFAGEGMMRSVGRLSHWATRVRQRREEEALRVARLQEEVGRDEDEG